MNNQKVSASEIRSFLKRQIAMDEQLDPKGWRTNDDGNHYHINASGEIDAGMGGKFNGVKVGQGKSNSGKGLEERRSQLQETAVNHNRESKEFKALEKEHEELGNQIQKRDKVRYHPNPLIAKNDENYRRGNLLGKYPLEKTTSGGKPSEAYSNGYGAMLGFSGEKMKQEGARRIKELEAKRDKENAAIAAFKKEAEARGMTKSDRLQISGMEVMPKAYQDEIDGIKHGMSVSEKHDAGESGGSPAQRVRQLAAKAAGKPVEEYESHLDKYAKFLRGRNTSDVEVNFLDDYSAMRDWQKKIGSDPRAGGMMEYLFDKADISASMLESRGLSEGISRKVKAKIKEFQNDNELWSVDENRASLRNSGGQALSEPKKLQSQNPSNQKPEAKQTAGSSAPSKQEAKSSISESEYMKGAPSLSMKPEQYRRYMDAQKREFRDMSYANLKDTAQRLQQNVEKYEIRNRRASRVQHYKNQIADIAEEAQSRYSKGMLSKNELDGIMKIANHKSEYAKRKEMLEAAGAEKDANSGNQSAAKPKSFGRVYKSVETGEPIPKLTSEQLSKLDDDELSEKIYKAEHWLNTQGKEYRRQGNEHIRKNRPYVQSWLQDWKAEAKRRGL